MVYDLSKSASILNHYVTQLRDVKVQQDRMRFRENIKRCGQLLAYEISKTFNYDKCEVDTPLGVAPCKRLDKQVVIASIMRAGLPFHNGFLSILDEADNAFVSAYRKHHKDGTFEIDLQYLTCPNLDDSILIIGDAMLATGASIHKTIQSMGEYGKPHKIHIATVIASTEGIKYIQRFYPNVNIWTCAIDEELTAKSYIVPGLGDAGDLSFGEKMQD
nr:uracil phosphoribosyltransferase [Saprospiraceae bacterium]